MILASIPSPSQGVWNLGPLPLRAYALLIIAGILVAVWLGNRRYVERGGTPSTVTDIAKKVLAADEAKRKKTAAKRAKSAPKKSAASDE